MGGKINVICRTLPELSAMKELAAYLKFQSEQISRIS
jgi:hypothetical protein